MSRLLIIPDEKFEPLTVELKTRLVTIANELRCEHLTDLFGAEGALLLNTIDVADDSREIQIWGRSTTESTPGFVVVWTSKGSNDAAVGKVTAKLDRGLINQVFESERPEIKAGDFLNASDWTNLEQLRGAKLFSMAAHPITIFRRCIAILSVSQFEASRTPQSADYTDAKTAGAAASLMARLVEDRLIRSCLGLTQA
jgi:hypothetical protein